MSKAFSHIDMNHKKVRPSRGFTLIELLVVIAILGALLTIALPVYNHYIDKAKLTLAYGATDMFRKAMELYHIDNHKYPQSIDFDTGHDEAGKRLLSSSQLEQFKDDLLQVVSYNSAISTYKLVVKAKDSDETVLTLTPNNVSQ